MGILYIVVIKERPVPEKVSRRYKGAIKERPVPEKVSGNTRKT
jgi:hypothetical protein